MKRLVPLLLTSLWACGCGVHGVATGTTGQSLLITTDRVAVPGETVDLAARVQVGSLLRGKPGYVVRFYREGRLFKAAETDENGLAAVDFRPDSPGQYRFAASVVPEGMAGNPPPPQELLVACWAKDSPIVVVDLDKTVVASGFHVVLLGDPKPIEGSQRVLSRLARDYRILYLTHRPEYFGAKGKAWLAAKGYPDGPLLLSDVAGFLAGSGQFKADVLARLRKKFARMEIGIGDKISDALAYHRNGLKAFLLLPEKPSQDAASLEQTAQALAALPEQVQVVTNWQQIEKAFYENATYPSSAAARRLKALAEKQQSTRPATSTASAPTRPREENRENR